MGDRTSGAGPVAAVADVRGFFETWTLFFYKGRADLVAFDAGGTVGVTDDNFVADVGTFALETLGAEIMRVIKNTLWVDIIQTVEAHFLGNRGGILAEVTGDLLKREAIIQGIFNKASVL